MLIRTSDGKTDVIDYREKAPVLATRDMYLDNAGNVSEKVSTDTHLASGVPGTVDGMNIRQAVDAGRFHHQWLPDWISYEKFAIDSLTSEKLREMGHILKERTSIGSVNAIMILPGGKKPGALTKEVIIHPVVTNSFCGSIFFTKLPQIYFH